MPKVLGSGNSAEAAKTAAVNALALYISTQVESALETTYSAQQTSENGRAVSSKETTDVSRNINVGVAAKLYALEMTDAYYGKNSKLWHVCAFINRAKAFAMIRSDIDTGNAIFAAVSTSLREAGFIVSDKGGCPYNVTVTVDMNIDTADMGKDPESGEQLVLYLSAKGEMPLAISSNGGAAFYTFATESKGGKVSAYTKSRVENKVCAALAETVRKELRQDFERFFGE